MTRMRKLDATVENITIGAHEVADRYKADIFMRFRPVKRNRKMGPALRSYLRRRGKPDYGNLDLTEDGLAYAMRKNLDGGRGSNLKKLQRAFRISAGLRAPAPKQDYTLPIPFTTRRSIYLHPTKGWKFA